MNLNIRNDILKYIIPTILASTLTVSTAFANTETECRQMIYEMEEYIKDEDIRNLLTSVEMAGLGYHDGSLYHDEPYCGTITREQFENNESMVLNGASLTGFVGRVTAYVGDDKVHITNNPERAHDSATPEGIRITYQAYRNMKERAAGLSDREKFDLVMSKTLEMIPQGSRDVRCVGNAVIYGKGSCGPTATLFCIFCGAAGIPVDIVECCTQPVYAPGKAHGYNRVTLDGKVYYTDAGYYRTRGSDYYLSETKLHYDLEEARRNAEQAGQNKH